MTFSHEQKSHYRPRAKSREQGWREGKTGRELREVRKGEYVKEGAGITARKKLGLWYKGELHTMRLNYRSVWRKGY